MDKPVVRIISVFGSLFVAMVALMAVLKIFGVVDTSMLRESLAKIAAAFGVLLLAAVALLGIQSINK